MKNITFYGIALLLIFLTSCKKEEAAYQVGFWNVQEVQIITTNGMETNQITQGYTLDLKENGEGVLNGIISNNEEIHWVEDELENTIFIIREFANSAGSVVASTTKFTIIKKEDSKQIWESEFSYTNPNNETVNNFKRWNLIKE